MGHSMSQSTVCLFLTFQHVPNHAPHISPAGIHECCMAWLGHSHVPVPSNSEVVPQLPHRQVGDPGSCVAAWHMAMLGGLLPHTAVTQAMPCSHVYGWSSERLWRPQGAGSGGLASVPPHLPPWGAVCYAGGSPQPWGGWATVQYAAPP